VVQGQVVSDHGGVSYLLCSLIQNPGGRGSIDSSLFLSFFFKIFSKTQPNHWTKIRDLKVLVNQNETQFKSFEKWATQCQRQIECARLSFKALRCFLCPVFWGACRSKTIEDRRFIEHQSLKLQAQWTLDINGPFTKTCWSIVSYSLSPSDDLMSIHRVGVYVYGSGGNGWLLWTVYKVDVQSWWPKQVTCWYKWRKLQYLFVNAHVSTGDMRPITCTPYR